MNILYYDCFSGISGDMNLAALIDLGVDPQHLRDELAKLNLGGYTIKVSRDMRHSIEGTRVDVELTETHETSTEGVHGHGHSHGLGGEPHDNGHDHSHGHDQSNNRGQGHSHDHLNGLDHDHGHRHESSDNPNHFSHHGSSHSTDSSHSHDQWGHHEHSHDHGHSHDYPSGHELDQGHSHAHGGGHEHVHRNLEDIRKIVEESPLSQRVKIMSMSMFQLIAEAEAKVHGTSIDQIHFHEVGAVDSIVDVVGAAIALDYLEVDKVLASRVELGGGFVDCAHGRMPVPAPATMEILKGVPVKTGTVNQETTTPTGAAILTANVEEFTDQPEMNVEKIGYGIGHRQLDIPNILRVYKGTLSEKPLKGGYQQKTALQISANVDDMNPEYYDYIMERLFEAGADEVYLTPVVMKKSRPASLLTVICRPDLEDQINRILFLETTTLGLRRTSVAKSELERKIEHLSTRYGKVRVKMGYLDGRAVKYKPEYEECKRIAKEQGLSLQLVCRHITEDLYEIL